MGSGGAFNFFCKDRYNIGIQNGDRNYWLGLGPPSPFHLLLKFMHKVIPTLTMVSSFNLSRQLKLNINMHEII